MRNFITTYVLLPILVSIHPNLSKEDLAEIKEIQLSSPWPSLRSRDFEAIRLMGEKVAAICIKSHR
jgi:hypothetical protein